MNANADYKMTEGKKWDACFSMEPCVEWMMAAALTFLVAIPANNDHWRVEIVKRGGGTWCFDKNGKLSWMWTAQPLSKSAHPAKVIVPQSRPKPISSPGPIDTSKL